MILFDVFVFQNIASSCGFENKTRRRERKKEKRKKETCIIRLFWANFANMYHSFVLGKFRNYVKKREKLTDRERERETEREREREREKKKIPEEHIFCIKTSLVRSS